MMQGLLTARQYFQGPAVAERDLYRRITRLWETVEWDWYRENAQSDFLYWHWSPQWGFQIHHPLIGFNEVMVVYLLAIASPTHGVPAQMYYSGWASQSQRAADYRHGWSGTTDGHTYANGHTYFGITLDVGVGRGGPLFFYPLLVPGVRSAPPARSLHRRGGGGGLPPNKTQQRAGQTHPPHPPPQTPTRPPRPAIGHPL